jgi:glycosyltransferase involved in cell wall biosynthesis
MQVTLEQHIKSLGLTDYVILKGFSSTVTDEMAKASLFISTSVSEGFSLTTLEAMSVGIPTVVYNCPGGIRYVVKDGETGYLVKMNDEDAFVEKVCALIENEELRKMMGRAALKEAQQYRVEKIVQRWMELFQELLEKKRGTKT